MPTDRGSPLTRNTYDPAVGRDIFVRSEQRRELPRRPNRVPNIFRCGFRLLGFALITQPC